MKLSTDIAPRRDGTVVVQTDDGSRYVFSANDRGELECNVDNDAHVDWLLDVGHFFPADESDIDTSAELPKKRGRKKSSVALNEASEGE